MNTCIMNVWIYSLFANPFLKIWVSDIASVCKDSCSRTFPVLNNRSFIVSDSQSTHILQYKEDTVMSLPTSYSTRLSLSCLRIYKNQVQTAEIQSSLTPPRISPKRKMAKKVKKSSQIRIWTWIITILNLKLLSIQSTLLVRVTSQTRQRPKIGYCNVMS